MKIISSSPVALNVRARCLSACWAMMFVLLAAIISQAQIGGIDPDPGDPGSGGRNTIQGNIYLPSGRRLDRRVRVRLSSLRGDFSAMTDDNGAFTFRRVAGGAYNVVVEAGADYEPVSERVDIVEAGLRRSGSGQVVTVQIQLRAASKTYNKPGLLNAALAGVPKPALELYSKALKLAQTGDSKKAIEELQKAIALYANFMLAFNELGVQYLNLGQLDKSVDALHTALKLDPNAFAPHLNYGIVLVHKRQFEDANTELRRALEINENSAIAHLYRGRALIYLSKYAEAEKELQRALKLDSPTVGVAHRYLGAIYNELGDKTRAIDELEKYLEAEPKAKDRSLVEERIKELRALINAPKK